MDVDLQACINGDKQAWDAFVTRWSGVIYAAVQRTTSRATLDRSEVEDIAQDVFIRLIKDDYRLLRRFDPGRASLSTWLTLVARSMAIDHLRRMKPHLPLEGGPELASVSKSRRTEGPTVPLHLLTGRQRMVLTLLFDRGLAVDEAASVMGVDAQTIRSTKHKAIIRLRDALETAAEPGSGGCAPGEPRND